MDGARKSLDAAIIPSAAATAAVTAAAAAHTDHPSRRQIVKPYDYKPSASHWVLISHFKRSELISFVHAGGFNRQTADIHREQLH